MRVTGEGMRLAPSSLHETNRLLLRAGQERIRRRACENRHEIAASHAPPPDLAPSRDYGSTEANPITADERRLAPN
jgi:hypothetical protein